ncbi:hypothetical protein ACQKCO_13255 [Shewanella baltica]|uniref:hypothetical protein n=1 Tax=Shewanella baltica TaxID=62322 RepID=UPI003D05E31C
MRLSVISTLFTGFLLFPSANSIAALLETGTEKAQSVQGALFPKSTNNYRVLPDRQYGA